MINLICFSFISKVPGEKSQLDNGKLINVAYAEQNGRAYTSIGGYLINQGLMTKDEIIWFNQWKSFLQITLQKWIIFLI